MWVLKMRKKILFKKLIRHRPLVLFRHLDKIFRNIALLGLMAFFSSFFIQETDYG